MRPIGNFRLEAPRRGVELAGGSAPRAGTATESMRSSARTSCCTRSCSSARIKHHRCLPRTRRARAHTHTPAHTHARSTHTVARAWMLMPTRHCMQLCNNERTHTHTAQPAHAHIHTHARTHARTHTCVHHALARVHAYSRCASGTQMPCSPHSVSASERPPSCVPCHHLRVSLTCAVARNIRPETTGNVQKPPHRSPSPLHVAHARTA